MGRAALTLVPVGLAIGTSSVVIGLVGLTLSPLTTVSGPLVIATCTEFSVLITARYLEERQAGKAPRDASSHAARRTGRAFFTSAATTIGGFAVLIGSALPLLRDFGVIVTLNVAVALLAALVVMPPLLVWTDGRGLFPIGTVDAERSVVLAARPSGARLVAWLGAVVRGRRGRHRPVRHRPNGVRRPGRARLQRHAAADDDHDHDRTAGRDLARRLPRASRRVAVSSRRRCSTGSRLRAPIAALPTAPTSSCWRTPPRASCSTLASSDPDTLFELVAEAARTCTVPEDVIQAAVDAGL
ncbi:MAG: MMPL family transporter [Acidimicrobiales bacterium]|nr:MMPL family transporter [Acidimicrobiales bacterium]